MTYLTVRAIVRRGKVELIDDISLPEDATLLVTVLDDAVMQDYTLGEHLAASLQDILSGRVTEVEDEQELSAHLDMIFNKS